MEGQARGASRVKGRSQDLASIPFDEVAQEAEALVVRVPEGIEQQPEAQRGSSIPGTHDLLNAPDGFSPPGLVPGEPDDAVK